VLNSALRRITVAASLAACLPVAMAQTIDGRVVGLGGKSAGATVTVLSHDGDVMGEVLVAADGTFAYKAPRLIGSIVVRQEAVAVTRGVVGGSATQVGVDLQAAVQWSRLGMVVDPDGKPATGLDVVARNKQRATVACVTTDERGLFVVRGSHPVTSLVVDPIGWHHVIAVGFDQDSTPRDTTPDVTIDLQPHAKDFLLLTGKVVALDGTAVADARVMASKPVAGSTTVCGVTRTLSDGTFRLWCAKGATKITAKKGGATWQQSGPWQTARPATLLLHEARDGIVLVSGTVIDPTGKPSADTIIYESQTAKLAKGNRGIAGTDEKGRFRIFIRRGTPYLIAHLRGTGTYATLAGPWPQPKVLLQPPK